MKSLLFVVAGALFGIGLAISGMTDPARVIGFLDLFGNWDPALLFVMAGAAGVYALGMFLLRNFQIGTLAVCPTGSGPIDRRLIIGEAVFGIGWGLGGFCPGPSLANLGGLRVEALIFVPAMALGMLIVQRAFKVDR